MPLSVLEDESLTASRKLAVELGFCKIITRSSSDSAFLKYFVTIRTLKLPFAPQSRNTRYAEDWIATRVRTAGHLIRNLRADHAFKFFDTRPIFSLVKSHSKKIDCFLPISFRLFEHWFGWINALSNCLQLSKVLHCFVLLKLLWEVWYLWASGRFPVGLFLSCNFGS